MTTEIADRGLHSQLLLETLQQLKWRELRTTTSHSLVQHHQFWDKVVWSTMQVVTLSRDPHW